VLRRQGLLEREGFKLVKRNSDGSSSYFVTGWESQKRLEEDGFSFPDSVDFSSIAEASKKIRRDFKDKKDLRISDIVCPIGGSYKGKQFTVVGFDWSDSEVPKYQVESTSLGKSFWVPFYLLKYLGKRRRYEVTPKEFRLVVDSEGNYRDSRIGVTLDYE